MASPLSSAGDVAEARRGSREDGKVVNDGLSVLVVDVGGAEFAVLTSPGRPSAL